MGSVTARECTCVYVFVCVLFEKAGADATALTPEQVMHSLSASGVTCEGSRVKGQGCRVTGEGSQVKGQG
eukprot:3939870-Rhodomonas_salina.1